MTDFLTVAWELRYHLAVIFGATMLACYIERMFE